MRATPIRNANAEMAGKNRGGNVATDDFPETDLKSPVICGDRGVTLVGGGEIGPADVKEALTLAPRLVAADGGAGAALAAGHAPEAVIGDFDSVTDETLARLPDARQVRVAEQDSTDFEKCLARIDAPLIVAVGFLGRRVDHQLAAMAALARETRPVVMVGRHDVVVHASRLEISPPPGSRLSLFPMARVTGRSDGLEWPIDGIVFAPDGRIGTSNRVTGPVRLAFDGPGMLTIMPRAALASVAAALRGPDGARATSP